jgi:hypothetical protein
MKENAAMEVRNASRPIAQPTTDTAAPPEQAPASAKPADKSFFEKVKSALTARNLAFFAIPVLAMTGVGALWGGFWTLVLAGSAGAAATVNSALAGAALGLGMAVADKVKEK